MHAHTQRERGGEKRERDKKGMANTAISGSMQLPQKI